MASRADEKRSFVRPEIYTTMFGMAVGADDAGIGMQPDNGCHKRIGMMAIVTACCQFDRESMAVSTGVRISDTCSMSWRCYLRAHFRARAQFIRAARRYGVIF